MKTPKLHVLPPSQPLPVSLLLVHCWWATDVPATAIYWSGLWTAAVLHRGLCDCRFLFKQLNSTPDNQLFENQWMMKWVRVRIKDDLHWCTRGWTTLLMYLYLEMNMCSIHIANGNDVDNIKFLLQCCNIMFHYKTNNSFCLFKNPATEVIRLEEDAVPPPAKKAKKTGVWSHCCHGSWSQQLSVVFKQDSGENLLLWWKAHQVSFPIWVKWHRNISTCKPPALPQGDYKHRWQHHNLSGVLSKASNGW